MFPSEKRSLIRFLIIYTISTLFLLGAGLTVFYRYNYHRLLEYQNQKLKSETDALIPKLMHLHKDLEKKVLYYPVKKGMQSAIYDIDLNYLTGDFKPSPFILKKLIKEEFVQNKGYIYYATKVYPHYLGAAYLVSRTKLDKKSFEELKNKIFLFFLLSAILISVTAYWLGKLFLFPMKNALSLLDNFIKDTTHELNTPITTILTNTELLKEFYPKLNDSEELFRIEIASKKLSRIYDDLAYLKLKHKRYRKPAPTDVSEILKERIEYFAIIATAKKIEIKTDIKKEIIIFIDKEDATRLMDNLISNALKYTKTNGKVFVLLNENEFTVKDTGIGIDEKDKKFVTKRFFRANESEGGFGIGLSIVEEIAKHYGFELKIESLKNQGTKVTVKWKKR